MKVIHEYTGKFIDHDFAQKVVIGEQDGHILFGYVKRGEAENVNIVKSNYETFSTSVYYNFPKNTNFIVIILAKKLFALIKTMIL